MISAFGVDHGEISKRGNLARAGKYVRTSLSEAVAGIRQPSIRDAKTGKRVSEYTVYTPGWKRRGGKPSTVEPKVYTAKDTRVDVRKVPSKQGPVLPDLVPNQKPMTALGRAFNRNKVVESETYAYRSPRDAGPVPVHGPDHDYAGEPVHGTYKLWNKTQVRRKDFTDTPGGAVVFGTGTVGTGGTAIYANKKRKKRG